MPNHDDGSRFARVASIVIAGAIGSLLTFATLGVLRPSILKPVRHGQMAIHHPTPIAKVDGLLRSLRVKRADDLSFHLIALFGETPVRMLVDTGANITVLTRDDAARIGIPVGDGTERHIDVIGINSTASRFRSSGSHTIGLGPIVLTRVPVAVDDSGGLKNSILGQDAMCGIDRILIQQDEIEFLHTRVQAPSCSDEPEHPQ